MAKIIHHPYIWRVNRGPCYPFRILDLFSLAPVLTVIAHILPAFEAKFARYALS